MYVQLKADYPAFVIPTIFVFVLPNHGKADPIHGNLHMKSNIAAGSCKQSLAQK